MLVQVLDEDGNPIPGLKRKRGGRKKVVMDTQPLGKIKHIERTKTTLGMSQGPAGEVMAVSEMTVVLQVRGVRVGLCAVCSG